MPSLSQFATAGLALTLLAGQALASPPTLATAWDSDAVFQAPESVAFDPLRRVLYVSNIAGEGTDRNGEGHISLLSVTGEVVEQKWITGLNAPKGIRVFGDRLYAADIDTLIEIDLDVGQIVARYQAKDAQFLNDVTVSPSGTVFVSDTWSDALYRLEDGALKLWLKDVALDHPNGLRAEDDRLVVATWGIPDENWVTEVPGRLLTVDYATRTIQALGPDTPFGNLDGLEVDASGNYLLTDWMSGAIYRFDEVQGAQQIGTLAKGAADHAFVPTMDLLVVPLMNSNKVVALRVP